VRRRDQRRRPAVEAQVSNAKVVRVEDEHIWRVGSGKGR
jgi:hypothetical protein